jgi:hypothetical protein
LEQATELSGQVSELVEQAAELLEQVSELFDHQSSVVLRKVKVCQKDVRCSSKKILESSSCGKCAHLSSGHRSRALCVFSAADPEGLGHLVKDKDAK